MIHEGTVVRVRWAENRGIWERNPRHTVEVGGPEIAVRHYAKSRKVAGSIPDEVTGFFNLPNPCSRTVTLESTQPLT
jgi:hypothetical protein